LELEEMDGWFKDITCLLIFIGASPPLEEICVSFPFKKIFDPSINILLIRNIFLKIDIASEIITKKKKNN
jgi:hypothetical protein